MARKKRKPKSLGRAVSGNPSLRSGASTHRNEGLVAGITDDAFSIGKPRPGKTAIEALGYDLAEISVLYLPYPGNCIAATATVIEAARARGLQLVPLWTGLLISAMDDYGAQVVAGFGEKARNLAGAQRVLNRDELEVEAELAKFPEGHVVAYDEASGLIFDASIGQVRHLGGTFSAFPQTYMMMNTRSDFVDGSPDFTPLLPGSRIPEQIETMVEGRWRVDYVPYPLDHTSSQGAFISAELAGCVFETDEADSQTAP